MAGKAVITFNNIDTALIAKWQGIADLLAKIISVPTALVMKTENEYMEVLVSSKTDNNPYHSGDKEKWHGLYCETVIKTQKELCVPDATADLLWSNNPDIKLGMIAYLGYPINFPDKRPFGTLCVLDNKENTFTSLHKKLLIQLRDSIEMDIALLEKDTLRNQTEARLKKIEWMLSPEPVQASANKADSQEQGYGDLTKLNLNGIILKSVGHELLREVAEDYLGLLGTSSAIYEVNGDYAFGIFASRWCQMMDRASRKLCDTSDNAKALNSGRWLCHESCWTNCTRIAIAECRPVDIECNGGIRIYCEPIMTSDKVVGAINFGYGDPPQEKAKLQKLAYDYNIQYDDLLAETESYESRPLFIVEQAKKRLHATARLIGSMVEQKQTEQVLRSEKKRAEESEVRFKTLHNASFGGIVIHDKGLILDCNQGLSEITGYSQQELIGMDGLLLIAKQSKLWVMDHILAGHEKPYEAVGVRKDGSEYPLRLEGRQIPYHGKEVRVVEFRDITDQKQAEIALQENKLRAEQYLNMVSEIIISLDRQGNITLLNDSGHKLLGYAPGELIRKNWFQTCLPEDNVIEISENFSKLINEELENFKLFENTVKTKNGLLRHVLWHNTLLKDAQHVVVGVLSSGEDITERKIAEETGAAEKERLAVTLRSIGDGVITTDIIGNVVIMNKVAEELCGWNQDEAQGKPLASVFNIIDESTRKPHENPVEKVLASGKIIELANHTLLIARDSTERVIADSGAPIIDKHGKTLGVVLVFRDMTEKKKLEIALEVSSKLESLGVLAGGIAHDFNNLLGGIYGYIDMASESSNDENVTHYLSKTMATIERARDLTGQLLTFAKGGAPVQKIAPLFPFIQETSQFALSGSKVSCDFDLQPDLWNCNYDRNQVGQVIDNLIINAQQAMPFGGTITVSGRNITLAEKEHPLLAKGDYVRISVKDSGIGMPKELLTKIFDPFFTTKTKGHGLGLATCYSIINRHSGCIDVYSEPGKGSVFHVYLPAAKESGLYAEKKTGKQHKGSGTFLVMDDEEVMQETISNILSSLGYTVVCKETGKDAVDYVAHELKTGRVLTGMIFDLTVPGGMGGKDAVAEIRKLNIETPVFVASGYADDSVMKNPEKYGFTASICKPFRRIELIEMLGKHIKTGNQNGKNALRTVVS